MISMVMSMTGYGRDVVTLDNSNITVEIRSVNHRFLDVSIKMPRSLLFLEDKMKKIIQTFFYRGRIDIYISLEGEGFGSSDLIVNWELMDKFIHSMDQIKERYGLEGKTPVHMVTQLEGLFTVQEKEQGLDRIQEVILNTVNNAAEKVYTMRKSEGTELKNDVVSRINFIQNIVTELGKRRDIVIMEYRERIKQRLEDYVQEEITTEPTKILHEVALLAEKGDITEEVTRLFSHISQFLATLDHEGSVGRKLDFIVQEMHRETNTIGSKSNDVKISEWVVTLKSEIEKVKEQVQNIE